MKQLLCLLTSLCLILSCSDEIQISPSDYGPDLAIEWNAKIFDAARDEDGLLTLKGLRTAAMTHIAMHDALNTIVPEYTRYDTLPELAEPAHPVAAAAQAAYEVVNNQYPGLSEVWKTVLARQLSTVEPGALLDAGIALGKLSAHAILTKRSDDGWNSEALYTWQPMAPGVYAEFNEHSGTPEGFVFGAGWAGALPFTLDSARQFRSPPPPNIDSKAYTDAFDEVKEVGRDSSQTRTEDQEHLAMWWKDFIENSHNRLLRRIAEEEELDLWQATRSFALLNIAIYDAYICVFENKFYYNHWRPYTAIRWAEHDENEETDPDTSWNNLHHHTYPFPSYPSAHGTAAAAAMTVLDSTIEVREDFKLTMRTDSVDIAGPFSGKMAMDPATRTFDSFMDAAMEASLSRVYLGIHFRYDSEEGYALGSRIGRYVCTYLTPID